MPAQRTLYFPAPAVERIEKSAIEELALLNTTPNSRREKDRQDEILVCSAYFCRSDDKSIHERIDQ